MCPRNYDCFGCPDRGTNFCPFENNDTYIDDEEFEQEMEATRSIWDDESYY